MKAIIAGLTALAISTGVYAGGKDISGITYVQEIDAMPSVVLYDAESQKVKMKNILRYYGGFYLGDSYPYAELSWDADQGCFALDELIEEGGGRTRLGIRILQED